MTIDISRSQAEHLAALVHVIRPDWDIPGIRAALWLVRTRPLALVAYAAVRAAETPSNRTPAVIALDGPHWRAPAPAALPTPGPPGKCPRCGCFARTPFGACLDCDLAATPPADDTPPADASRDLARAAIRNAKSPEQLEAERQDRVQDSRSGPAHDRVADSGEDLRHDPQGGPS